VSAIGLALALLTVACAHLTAAPPANRHCGSPVEIGAVLSLLPPAPRYAQGIFTYRSVDYRITIRRWEWRTYQGPGFVCGLGAPADIAGFYTVEKGGAVLRNDNGVKIELETPLPAQPSAPKLEIQLAGALLPRQP
jgi:hypothetical protein